MDQLWSWRSCVSSKLSVRCVSVRKATLMSLSESMSLRYTECLLNPPTLMQERRRDVGGGQRSGVVAGRCGSEAMRRIIEFTRDCNGAGLGGGGLRVRVDEASAAERARAMRRDDSWCGHCAALDSWWGAGRNEGGRCDGVKGGA